jgi:Flp pilus assembly protein TadD
MPPPPPPDPADVLLSAADARYRAGDFVGAEEVAGNAVAAAEESPPLVRARMLNAHGYFLYRTGRYPLARSRFEAARAL